MKNYFSLLLFLAMASLSKAQYTPTFPNLIQTGKFLFTPSGAIPPGGFSLTITFSLDKNNTNYSETLSYQNLFLNINDFCYSIRLQSLDKTSNSEKVLITSNCSCVLNWVSVRYLVVQPALAASVQLIPIERSYSTPQLLQSSTNTIITITYSPFQGASATLQPAAILRGITIRNNKNGARNEYIDFQVRATLGASVVITLSGISSQAQIYIQFVSLTVILLQESISIGTVTSSFPLNYLQTDNSASISNITTTYSDGTTFMGISKFTNMNNRAYLRNQVNINSNSVTLVAYDSNIFEIVVINFAFKQCTSVNPYFLPANSSCLSACPSNCDVNFTASFLCGPCNLTTCANGSYLSNSSCLPCDSSCVTCDSLLNCTSCNASYSLQYSLCVLNCTSLLNSSAVFISNSTCQACPTGCLTCSNSSYCSSCASPYFFDLNRCVLNCSLVRNASYLLNGSCLSCNSTCTDCLNSSYCTGCSQNATFLSNGQCVSCGANCQSCLNASQCTSCDSAFFIDGGFCLPNCSTISNSTYLRNRTCERCPIGCASCNNQSYCTTCNNNYNLSGNNTCVPDCSLIGNCSACTVLSSTKIYCTLCSQGYSASSGACKSSCGDGYYIGAEEGCDDGNSENGDGCSSQCRVEPNYWVCNSREGNNSLCKLKSMSIGPSYLVKSYERNSIIVYISVSPKTNIYHGLAWNQGISFPNGMLLLEKAYFDSNKQSIVIEASYKQSLTPIVSLSLQLVSSLVSPKLDLVPTKMHQINLVAQNDLSLQYFPEQAYSVAAFIEYYGIIIVSLSYGMFILGYLGGKVVVIQYFSLLQICSLGLLNISEASPTFGALRIFRFSLGSSFMGDYDYSQTLDRNFKGLYFTLNVFFSLGIVFFIVLLPIIVGAAIKVLSLTLCKERPLMKQLPPFLFCQYAFYGLLLSSSLIFAQLIVCFSSLESESADLAIGILFTLLLIIGMIAECFFLKKTPAFFGCITKNFVKFGIATYFWIIVLCFRFLYSLSIVLLRGSHLAMPVQLSLLTIMFLFILVSKPYVNSNFQRQGINFICTFSILGLEMTGRLVQGSQAVEVYLPLAICAIITIALLSNSFYFLQQIKPLLTSLCSSQPKESKGPSAQSSVADHLFQITMEPDIDSKNQKQFEMFERRMMGGESEQLHLIMKERLPLDCSPSKMDKERLDKEWQNYPVLAKSKMLEEIRYKIASMAGKTH